MKLITIDNKRLLKKFVDFPDELYKGDSNYVPYMKRDLTKTLTKLLFEQKTYCALAVTDDGKFLARILFTVAKNKQLKTDRCGYFSLFECVNNQKVADTLLNGMVNRLKAQNVKALEGTYTPFDQDNRRGILLTGFDKPPLILTSYNPPYYNDLLTDYGMQKHFDTYEYSLTYSAYPLERVEKIVDYGKNKFDYRVDHVNLSLVEKEIKDLHEVMEAATNEIIFQEAPTIEALRSIVGGWKSYLEPDFIYIARRNSDDKPIGALMAIPDFFQVFQKMRGRTDLKGMLAYLKYRKKITKLRAMLQYVIPEYQNKGVNVAMYAEMQRNMIKHGIEYLEAGTIMENNAPSNNSIKAIGGKLARVYRIYGMNIK